jgi:5-methylcytosine-specific restriction endonuclease McrA
VNRIQLKAPRLRLNPEKYDQLRQRVLWRDGWRCQLCGSMSNLEVHHKELRSQSGEDSEQNLITPCVACHSLVHCQSANAGAKPNAVRKHVSSQN